MTWLWQLQKSEAIWGTGRECDLKAKKYSSKVIKEQINDNVLTFSPKPFTRIKDVALFLSGVKIKSCIANTAGIFYILIWSN